MKSKFNILSFLKSKQFLLISLTVFLAYGLTLFMYIWQDDNAIMFKLQHLQEGAGNLGQGIYDRNSTYRFVIVPLVPIFYFFKLNTFGYYLVGLFFYLISSLSVYLFVNYLINKRVAFYSAVIFASGYVGAESMWRIFNSIQTSVTIILLCLSLFFYLMYAKSKAKKIQLYLISLILFVLDMEFGFVRAHGIILILLALEFLYNFKLFFSIFRVLPFLLMFSYYYAFGNTNTAHITLLYERIFINYDFKVLLVPLQTLKNVFIPDLIHLPLYLFLASLVFIIFKLRDKNLWFGLIFTIANFLTYFFIYQESVLESTHRYLTVSVVGEAIFLAVLFDLAFKKEKYKNASVIFLVLIHLILVNIIQLNFLKNISFPTRNFYSQLKREIPSLEKGAVIYFDVRNNAQDFRKFFGVGSMPDSTAIAIHYYLDRYDIALPQSFDEFLQTILKNQTKQNQIYTFVYGKNGQLVNTSNETRSNLFKVKGAVAIADINQINLSSVTPLDLNFQIETNLNQKLDKGKGLPNYKNYLDYLVSKKNFYTGAEATSTSQWKMHEVGKVVDNNMETTWMANRVNWHYQRKEELLINLKEVKEIGGVKITFGPRDKVSTVYTYYCLQNAVWGEWKKIYFQPKHHGEVRVDKLDPRFCSEISIRIEDTVDHDSPEIAEVEPIEERYASLNQDIADHVSADPTLFVESDQDKESLVNYLRLNGVLTKVCFITDQGLDESDCQKLDVRINSNEVYKLTVPAGGVVLRQLKIVDLPSLSFKIYNVTGSPKQYPQLKTE